MPSHASGVSRFYPDITAGRKKKRCKDKVGHEKTELSTSVASSDGNLTIREKCLWSHVEAIAAMGSRAQLYK